MNALAAALGAGDIGTPFFCAITLTRADETMAAALLALAARRLGPVSAIEARHAPPLILVQAVHGEALSQLSLRTDEILPPAIEIELDGKDASLRLDPAGRLWRHGAGQVEELRPAPADPPSGAEIARILPMLRDALSRPERR